MPTSFQMFSMGSANGGGYVANRKQRGELNLTRGVRYRLEVVALDNPLCFTLSQVGGALAPAAPGDDRHGHQPSRVWRRVLRADASLPDSFYYNRPSSAGRPPTSPCSESTSSAPRGVSKLRFGATPSHPLATLRARNGSMIEAVAPAQPAGTTALGVVFSPNGAEEDYLSLGYGLGQLLDYTYHDEPVLQYVVPAGTPIHGGTNLTLVGTGFDQATTVLTDDRLRCIFDPNDGVKEVLPQATGVYFRNATHVVCPTPPSWLGRPPYQLRRPSAPRQPHLQAATCPQRLHRLRQRARRSGLRAAQHLVVAAASGHFTAVRSSPSTARASPSTPRRGGVPAAASAATLAAHRRE